MSAAPDEAIARSSHIVWAVFRTEWVNALRDRRALTSILLVPVMGPLMLFMMVAFVSGIAASTAEVDLPMIGAERAPQLVASLAEQGITVTPAPDDARARVHAGELSLLAEVDEAFDEDLRAGQAATVRVYVDESDRRAAPLADHVERHILGYGARLGALRLIARGVHPAVGRPVAVTVIDVGDKGHPLLANLLGLIPLFLLLAAFAGGLSTAIDTTAGERERQSLESLLLTPTPRWALAVGKWLCTSLIGYATVALSLAGFFIAVRRTDSAALGVPLDLSPTTVLALLAYMLPVAMMAAALMMLAASFSRSFKEAQSWATVLIFLPVAPGVLSLLYGLGGHHAATALIPFWGPHQVLATAVTSPVPVTAALLSTGVNLALAALGVALVARQLHKESMLFTG